ncbi:MAG: c-type cytochrome [Anaerolineaceae bacterium]|nr:c-type cytochrome [Anaerolineaceae bacterium]
MFATIPPIRHTIAAYAGSRDADTAGCAACHRGHGGTRQGTPAHRNIGTDDATTTSTRSSVHPADRNTGSQSGTRLPDCSGRRCDTGPG